MKPYGEFCKALGLPPKLYFFSLMVGFSGAFGSGFTQAVEGYRELTGFCVPLVLAPVLVAQIYTPGRDFAGISKRLTAVFITMLCTFFPGVILGMLLGEHLR